MRHDDGQMEMLLSLYRGMGEHELLQLAAQTDDLTDVARDALAQAMRERSLSLPNAESADTHEEPAADPSLLQAGERWLWTFEDAFQAGDAIRLLTEARIWHRVIDKSSSGDEDRASRTLLGLIVIVEEVDYADAADLLHNKMGLFPKPEVENATGSPLSAMEGTELLSMFEREDALAVADALGRAGISYWWRDGKQETEELPDEGTVAIEVSAAQVRDAQAVAEKRLAEIA